MQTLIPEEEYVRKSLKRKFDKFFELYCTPLTRGVEVRLFMQDNNPNKILIGEFGEYIKQRADYEGWRYESKKFQVTYVPADKLPSRRKTFIANPLEKNIAFEEIRSSLYIRVDKEDADDLRNRL